MIGLDHHIPLIAAVKREDILSVQKLLSDKNILLNESDILGTTALMHASEHSTATGLSILKLLIDSRASLNQSDNQGRTALMYAISARNHAAAKNLVKAGANLNSQATKNGSGETPLSLCIIKNETNLALQFIDLKANVDVTLKNGINLIMLAIIKDNMTILSKLVNMNIPLDTASTKGNTALDIAIDKKNPIAIGLLIQAGVNIDKHRSNPILEPYLNKYSDLIFAYGFTRLASNNKRSHIKDEDKKLADFLVGIENEMPALVKKQVASYFPTIGSLERAHSIIEACLKVQKERDKPKMRCIIS